LIPLEKIPPKESAAAASAVEQDRWAISVGFSGTLGAEFVKAVTLAMAFDADIRPDLTTSSG
jgi:hypothetical protein